MSNSLTDTVTHNHGSHLIVLVNGLWGQAAHWKTMVECLESRAAVAAEGDESKPSLPLSSLSQGGVHVYVSQSNQLFDTYDGIDVCGDRLAKEVTKVVEERQQLGTTPYVSISFIGHSMGGLIARYCAGKLYDGSSRTMLGLTPKHFVSMATPHVGFSPQYEDVPLSSWIKKRRGIKYITRPILDRFVPWSTSLVLGSAGKQFFLRDDTLNPLVYTLSCGEYLDALASFQTRTCYANVQMDHLVGWSNASIRFPEEYESVLEHISSVNVERKGVVREDPIDSAWTFVPQLSESRENQNNLKFQSPPPNAHHTHILQHAALKNLQTVPFRRIDVCFKDGKFISKFLSHQNIMVQRPRINRIGLATVQHVSKQLFGYDTILSGGSIG